MVKIFGCKAKLSTIDLRNHFLDILTIAFVGKHYFVPSVIPLSLLSRLQSIMMLKYIRNPEFYLNIIKVQLTERFQSEKSRKWFAQYHSYFKNKKGLEVGGPSPLFTGNMIPVYKLAAAIDGCNFSNATVWEGNIEAGEHQYHYSANKSGTQYIAEGSSLPQINNDQYDFLLSCHNLEHIANPIKAVAEWKRVIKKNGVILLVLPDKRFTFDKKRPYTNFEHLLADYKNNTAEDDLTHLPEVLSLHHLNLDPIAGKDVEAFRERCRHNFDNRCLHHHVFSLDVLSRIFQYLDMEVIGRRFVPGIHEVVIGRK